MRNMPIHVKPMLILAVVVAMLDGQTTYLQHWPICNIDRTNPPTWNAKGFQQNWLKGFGMLSRLFALLIELRFLQHSGDFCPLLRYIFMPQICEKSKSLIEVSSPWVATRSMHMKENNQNKRKMWEKGFRIENSLQHSWQFYALLSGILNAILRGKFPANLNTLDAVVNAWQARKYHFDWRFKHRIFSSVYRTIGNQTETTTHAGTKCPCA